MRSSITSPSRLVAVMLSLVLLLTFSIPVVFADEIGFISFPDFTFEFTYDDSSNVSFFSFYAPLSFFEPSSTYILKVDSQVYKSSVHYFEGLFYIGNLFLIFASEDLDSNFVNTGEDFLVFIDFADLQGESVFMSFYLSGQHESVTLSLTPYEANPYTDFLYYVSFTFHAVINWASSVVASLVAPEGAFYPLFPFVAITFAIGLVWGGIVLTKKFIPGF